MKRSRKLRVLVTGGPTRAWLDRVRFLTNISSGELAFHLCRELIRRGAEVALVSGPSSQPFETLALDRWDAIETTEEMHAAVLKRCRAFRPDAAIFTAAVLDFEPERRESGKVTSATGWTLRLKPTKKIIDEVGRRFPKVRRVGFKLEWKPHSRAAEKALLEKSFGKKTLDALCLNYLAQIRGGAHPARLFTADGLVASARTKRELAKKIAAYVTATPKSPRPTRSTAKAKEPKRKPPR